MRKTPLLARRRTGTSGPPPVSIGFVSVGAAYTQTSRLSAGATYNVGAPAGIVAGNLLLAAQFLDDNGVAPCTAPAGWSELFGQAPGGPYNIYVFYKFAAAGDVGASTYTFTATDGGYPCGGIVQYSGVSSGSPFDGSAALSENAAGTNMTAPSANAGAASDWLVCFFGNYNDLPVKTGPTGMALRINAYSAGNVAGFLYDQALSAQGATGARTATLATSDTNPWGLSLLLKAA